MEKTSKELTLITNRIRESLRTELPEPEVLDTAVQSQQKDGSWEDIDYASNTDAAWMALEHLRRLRSLSAVLAADTPRRTRQELFSAICKGLTFWYHQNFVNPNWWNNDIGKQMQLRDIGLLLKEHLPKDLLRCVTGDLQTEVTPWQTGANLIWYAENVLYRGLLTGDMALVRYAAQKMESTIHMAKSYEEEDGIQPDYSFTQHRRQLYNNGYGRAFLIDTVKWMERLHGTQAAFSPGAVQMVTDLFLEGNRWMFRYDQVDFSTEGREIARYYQPGHLTMRDYLPPLSSLAQMQTDPARTEGLMQMAEHIRGERPDPGVTGNRMFWRTDFMTHLRPDYYASVRMLSNGVVGGECNNRENILAGFGAYGLTSFMTHGREYNGIFGLWDWAHLPGVTCPAVELPTDSGSHMDTIFAGGVSDGIYGAAGMEIDKTYEFEDIESHFCGHKSVFFFDSEIVCVGSGFSSNAPQPLETTLNQCYLRGEVLVDGQNTASDTPAGHRGQTIWHDGIGYVFPSAQDFQLKAGRQEGNWHRVSQAEDSPDAVISAEIFRLSVTHGTGASNKGYAYTVLPGATAEQTAAYPANSKTDILRLDNRVHAVWHRGLRLCAALFFDAGAVERNGVTLEADAPCMVLYRPDRSGTLACPLEIGQITLTLKQNGLKRATSVILPGDPILRGKPVPFQF